MNIENMNTGHIGRWVFYMPNKEYGRIKSWNEKWIFVVYKCAGEWDNYKNYTAAATNPQDLRLAVIAPTTLAKIVEGQ